MVLAVRGPLRGTLPRPDCKLPEGACGERIRNHGKARLFPADAQKMAAKVLQLFK